MKLSKKDEMIQEISQDAYMAMLLEINYYLTEPPERTRAYRSRRAMAGIYKHKYAKGFSYLLFEMVGKPDKYGFQNTKLVGSSTNCGMGVAVKAVQTFFKTQAPGLGLHVRPTLGFEGIGDWNPADTILLKMVPEKAVPNPNYPPC